MFISSQVSFEPPQVAKFDPYTPRINLDSANVKQSKDFAAALKTYLAESVTLPPEARLQRLKTANPQGTRHCNANHTQDLQAGLARAVAPPGELNVLNRQVKMERFSNELLVCAEAKGAPPVQPKPGAKKKQQSKESTVAPGPRPLEVDGVYLQHVFASCVCETKLCCLTWSAENKALGRSMENLLEFSVKEPPRAASKQRAGNGRTDKLLNQLNILKLMLVLFC